MLVDAGNDYVVGVFFAREFRCFACLGCCCRALESYLGAPVYSSRAPVYCLGALVLSFCRLVFSCQGSLVSVVYPLGC